MWGLVARRRAECYRNAAKEQGMVENWLEEKRSAYLYRVMAACEPDNVKRALFTDLAEEADRQASIWEGRMRSEGVVVPPQFRPGTRAALTAWLVRLLGPRAMRGALAAMKVRGLSIYRTPSVAGHAMGAAFEC